MTGAAIPGNRGNFHSRYAVPALRNATRERSARLLDCLLCIAQRDDPEYLAECDAKEFAVVDFKTKEKAWFEAPPGATDDVICGMVESTFAASAIQVAPTLWIV